MEKTAGLTKTERTVFRSTIWGIGGLVAGALMGPAGLALVGAVAATAATAGDGTFGLGGSWLEGMREASEETRETLKKDGNAWKTAAFCVGVVAATGMTGLGGLAAGAALGAMGGVLHSSISGRKRLEERISERRENTESTPSETAERGSVAPK